MAGTRKPRLPFAKAAKNLGVHISSLHRWRTIDVAGGIRLSMVVIDGRRFVEQESIGFVTSVTEVRDGN